MTVRVSLYRRSGAVEGVHVALLEGSEGACALVWPWPALRQGSEFAVVARRQGRREPYWFAPEHVERVTLRSQGKTIGLVRLRNDWGDDPIKQDFAGAQCSKPKWQYALRSAQTWGEALENTSDPRFSGWSGPASAPLRAQLGPAAYAHFTRPKFAPIDEVVKDAGTGRSTQEVEPLDASIVAAPRIVRGGRLCRWLGIDK